MMKSHWGGGVAVRSHRRLSKLQSQLLTRGIVPGLAHPLGQHPRYHLATTRLVVAR
jgi:hypothetical protein